MRIAVVQPGDDYATHDVYQGIVEGLVMLGHEVTEYDYGFRLTMAEVGRQEMWRLYREVMPNLAQPGHSVVAWDAGHALYSICALGDIEAVVIVTAEHWHPDHIILLRRMNIPVGIVHTEGPYADDLMAVKLSLANVLWCNERTSVARLQEAARLMEMPAQVKYLPVGYNSKVHRPDLPALPEDLPTHDVVFVGTGFKERVDLLERVDWSGINFGLYGHWTHLRPNWGFTRRGMDPRSRGVRPGVHRLAMLRWLARMRAPGVSPLWAHLNHGVLANKYAADLYRKAKIGLNLGRSSSQYLIGRRQVEPGESMGPRPYELAACGLFFISEYRAEIPEVFDDLVPTFTTADELSELLRYWLHHPMERAARAALLPECVERHSYRHRAAAMVRDLREAIESRGSVYTGSRTTTTTA